MVPEESQDWDEGLRGDVDGEFVFNDGVLLNEFASTGNEM
jgi:hypothetical protein